jgi:hypothetical protein
MPANAMNNSDRGETVIYQPPSGAATIDVRPVRFCVREDRTVRVNRNLTGLGALLGGGFRGEL